MSKTKKVPTPKVEGNQVLEGKNPFVRDRMKMGSQTHPPIVSIHWLDASIKNGGSLQVGPGWEQGYRSGVMMHAVGFLLKQDKVWHTIAMERNGENDMAFRDVQDIPTYSIVQLEVLKRAKG